LITYLLDVNILMALLDAGHEHHEIAHDWFARIGSAYWATCPITENGVIRIMAQPRYPKGLAQPAAVASHLEKACQQSNHIFWPDDLSLLDSSYVESRKISSHKQVTDTYLLALAVKHGGQFATFDRRLVTTAVKGGAAALHIIGG
jgi:uncharacterized protein